MEKIDMDFGYVGAHGDALTHNEHASVASRIGQLARSGAFPSQVHRGVTPESEWRKALHAMCEEARLASVPPEQLLREIKQALAVLCDTCGVPHGPSRTAFTNRVVTMTIEEYSAAA
jgi:hypothetical protein